MKLKPCPFCGSEAELHDGVQKDACLCPNSKCLLFARLLYIPLWNHRPIEDKQAEQIRQLEYNATGILVKRRNDEIQRLKELLFACYDDVSQAMQAKIDKERTGQ